MRFKSPKLILPAVLCASSLLLAACEEPRPPQQVKCIDTQGNTVFDLTLPTDRHKPIIIDSKFREGRLIWGSGRVSNTFIDNKGKLLPGNHNSVSCYSEGLAAVRDNYVDDKTNEATDRWGFIDLAGKLRIAQNFQNVAPFSQGLAAALPYKEVSKTSKWGFIDKSGKWAVAPQFEDAKPFSEGLAAVQVGSKWGFIKPDGSYAVKPLFLSVGSFHSERAMACPLPDRHVVYIDKTGKQVYSTDYNELDSKNGPSSVIYQIYNPLQPDFLNYSEGVVCARKDGKSGYKDKDGNWAIKPQFERVYPFSCGRAVVTQAGRYGFIDRSGKAITEIKYDFAIPFSDNIGATFEHGKGYSYIDLSGKPLFGKYFKVAYPFSDGKAIVNFKRDDNTPADD